MARRHVGMRIGVAFNRHHDARISMSVIYPLGVESYASGDYQSRFFGILHCFLRLWLPV